MRVIPAIDIRHGKVVRLEQGRADLETVYDESPLAVARKWASFGVPMIHVVDLDGAFAGEPKNLAIAGEIARDLGLAVQLGGGIRDDRAIRAALEAGVVKVVIGTRALDESFLAAVVREFGERIVVGIDASAGTVRTKGWVAETNVKAVELARKVEAAGVRTINYTDITRDGMLEGPNLASLQEILRAVSVDVIAAGGVSTIDDVRALAALGPKAPAGCIIGKALYEGKVDLKEAMAACQGRPGLFSEKPGHSGPSGGGAKGQG